MDGLLFEKHLTADEIEAGIEHVLASPRNKGTVELIVVRPGVGKRQVLEVGEFDLERGLIGDNWLKRGSKRTPDGSAHPDMQVNVMNYRFAELVAGERNRVPLAGDQLFVDLYLGPDSVQPGTRLRAGTVVLEVTSLPHLGCKKFVERFGLDAMKYANSEFGRSKNLRGLNARVVEAGNCRSGDLIERI
ncbi:MAG TPA: hypothetical protein VK918_05810 [Pyrinomonadaceae bacterium]|nr:hypothetical protein [Pyrinomonadaceae bacterium]